VLNDKDLGSFPMNKRRVRALLTTERKLVPSVGFVPDNDTSQKRIGHQYACILEKVILPGSPASGSES
jgi:hypothetical protein